MKLPIIQGVIERRILVNYRVDPQILAPLLPAPFRPQLVRGFGLVGICLIRLAQVRPAGWPAALGLSSENAAHRSAVEWDGDDGEVRKGVYVRRRDTNSWLNSMAGGRLFPGVYYHAAFDVRETEQSYDVRLRSNDRQVSLAVQGRPADSLPASSVFASLEEASAFFQAGSLGYSATSDVARHQGMELRCRRWSVEPLAVDEVQSSLFDDERLFPPGSIEFDCALLMRDIEHEWHSHDDLCCGHRTRPEDTPVVAP